MSLATWRLDTTTQTVVFASWAKRLPSIVYWGRRLSELEDLTMVAMASRADVTGGMLDENPEISLCPEASRSFPGQSGIQLRQLNGQKWFPRWRLQIADVTRHKVIFIATDVDSSLVYEAQFQACADSGLIKATSLLKAEQSFVVDWLAAPVVPVSGYGHEIVDFSGRWCGEFQEQRTPWRAGAHSRHNPTGRTGHEHFPGAFFTELGCTNTSGHCYGLHYAWSGGHDMIAEQMPDGRRQVQFGHAHGSQLQPMFQYASAPLYLAYSNHGMNGCAIQFQREVRRTIVRPTQAGSVRPVHYNCWEAVYFKHNVDELMAIAQQAASLGAERFVLDDGWFGTRDDDTQSLGDWWIDARKYPDGLEPLVTGVKQLGMQFGIWFEPEMINDNSDIYRLHSDWVLGPEDQILGRQQKVLNLSREEVRQYLFERISDLLSTYRIDYIKWDHNRVLPHYDNDQITGVYKLIDRLRASFPEVEIETCASGGGRIDFGMLERTQRVWLSDSNDAIERSRIQAAAARFLPASVTGSHVGPRHCHTSGRNLSIQFRSWVAAQRHMGFEMDPRELTSEEAEVLQRITTWWKHERAFLMEADIHLLDNQDPSVICEQHMSASQARFILFANKVDTSSQILPATIRLTQLIPERNYTITLVNRDELHHLSRGTPLLKHQSLTVSGLYLMHKGIELPWSFPCQTWTLVGEMIHD